MPGLDEFRGLLHKYRVLISQLRLASKDFGLPEKARTPEQKRESGNYPMPDKAQARNAKARASQQHEAGHLSDDELKRIDRKADRILNDDK